MPRYVHAREPELRRQLRGVHGARAAECDEREVAGILPALDRDHAHRTLHGGRRHAHDPRGGVLDRAAEATRERRDCGDGAPAVDVERAAQELRLDEPAEHEVGVGDRRLGATPVAGRARIGAGALRADEQRSARIQPRERAATGTDRVDVERRHAHRQAIDAGLRAVGERPVDQAHVGGRAAHVERDDRSEPRPARRRRGTDDPARRAGQDRAHRLDGRRARGRQPAARLHHAEAARHGAGERPQVTRHQRADVRVHHDRRRPLVLPVLAHEAVGEREMDAARRERSREEPLVSRSGVAVQQAHRHRLGAVPQHRVHQAGDRAALERPLDAAVGEHPLLDAEPPRAWHEGRRPAGLERVE